MCVDCQGCYRHFFTNLHAKIISFSEFQFNFVSPLPFSTSTFGQAPLDCKSEYRSPTRKMGGWNYATKHKNSSLNSHNKK